VEKRAVSKKLATEQRASDESLKKSLEAAGLTGQNWGHHRRELEGEEDARGAEGKRSLKPKIWILGVSRS